MLLPNSIYIMTYTYRTPAAITLKDLLTRVINTCNKISSSPLLRSKIGWRSQVGKRIQESITNYSHIDLLIYWGAYKKDEILENELQLINMLEELRLLLSTEADLDVFLHLIFTDTHARLNNVRPTRYKKYFESVQHNLPSAHWKYYRMSDICPLLDQEVHRDGDFDLFGREISLLLRDAERLHGNSVHSKVIARKYLHQNIFESAFVGFRWPRGIFMHSGMPELTTILPNLPTFYIYCGPNKQKKKPWFSDD